MAEESSQRKQKKNVTKQLIGMIKKMDNLPYKEKLVLGFSRLARKEWKEKEEK